MKGVHLTMKKTLKKILCAVLAVSFVLALTGCAKINYVTNGTITAIKEVKDGSWKDNGEGEGGSAEEVVSIEPFKAGTYGGVEFADEAAVAEYYVQAYNKTKEQTAQYKTDDGSTQTFYKLLGDEKLKIEQVLIEGSENAMINNLVPGIVDGLFAANTYGLPPCYNRNPELDNNLEDTTRKADHDFRTSGFTADDILACNVTDNGDGTITLVIQPKEGSMSMRGDDSQGRFFEVLGDIGATVDSISALSWASGTTEENCLVKYAGGTGTIKVDVASGEIVEADYHMAVSVEVNHANVAVIKDKSAVVGVSYDMHYPATDEYLMETKGITRL